MLRTMPARYFQYYSTYIVHDIPKEWHVHNMFNTANQTLGCKQLVLITLVPAGVFITISCEFLLVLGLRCCCCGILVERVGHGYGGRAEVQSSTTATVPHAPHQNHSRCALTLALTKIQLRLINADNNKQKKDKMGLS